MKKIIVPKSKEMKISSHLAESSKEGYGSKKCCILPIFILFLPLC
jgi:hypothetical protein